MSNEHDIEDDPLQAATLSESFANIPLHSAADPVNDVHIRPMHGTSPAKDSDIDAAAVPSASAILKPLSLSEEALEEERSKHIDWKEDYEKKLAEWRETAAVARAEVPLRHDKWEKIRETESEDEMLAELADAAREAPSSSSSTSHVSAADAKHDGEEDKDSGWESLGEASTMASSFVDARDLVSGETPGGRGAAALDAMFPPASLHPNPAAPTTSSGNKVPATTTTGGEPSAPAASTNHVDVDTDTLSDPPSRLSSFPSLDFDESSSDKNGGSSSKRRRATITMSNSRGLGGANSGKGDKSSSPRSKPSEHTSATTGHHHHHHQQPQPVSVTLAVFDSSLPTRTRILAVVSAVAINFCLPFINGVMLGFGEIFAKNIVNWIQIKRGKATPAVAGVGLSTGKRK